MPVSKFEIGKRYSYKGGNTAKCIAIANDDGDPILRVAMNTYISPCNPDNWNEVKEPVVEKVVRYVVPSAETDGAYYTTSCKFNRSIGSVELTITDGKLTDAKVL